MAVEQLLGGAGGSWTVHGAPESGRDLRQIVPRCATRRRRPGVGKDEEGSFVRVSEKWQTILSKNRCELTRGLVGCVRAPRKGGFPRALAASLSNPAPVSPLRPRATHVRSR